MSLWQAFWAITISGAMFTGIATSKNPQPARGFRVSLSVSPFTEAQFGEGIVFTDGKMTAVNSEGLQRLFVSHGANEVYARIASRQERVTGEADHSMQRGLERARLARALNLPFNPELGLFEMYGDVRCQPPPDFHDYPEIRVPAEWTSLRLKPMIRALRAYGAAAARQIAATGVRVGIWDIGNEIEFGIAGVAVQPLPGGCDDTMGRQGWYRPPDGVDVEIGRTSVAELMAMPEMRRIGWLETHLWPHEAKMLAAVAEGVRSVDRQARFSTHVSGISSVLQSQAVAFFRAMKRGGFAADELGLSYYPTSSSSPKDRLRAFQDVATALEKALGKPVFIAEFGYPAGPMQRIFNWNDAVQGYPLSADGQARFIRELIGWGTRNGVLSGIRLWGPDFVGPEWGPMSMFDLERETATARPALDAVVEGVAGRR